VKVSSQIAHNWFKRFSDRDTSLEDEPHSGRPVTVDSKALCEAVGNNQATSIRQLSAELNILRTLVVRHLHQLGKVKKRSQELTPTQAQWHVDTCC
jgi:hypothetical protein